MSSFSKSNKVLLAAILYFVAVWAEVCPAQPLTAGATTNGILIAEAQGTVEISPAKSTRWVLTTTNQILYPEDRLRTGTNSRVALKWSDQSVVAFGASTELEILPPHAADAQSGLRLFRGIMSFFHRDQPGRIRIITRGAVAGVEGTEFVLEVGDENGTERTTLSVIDGRVKLANEAGTLVLTNGEQAFAELNRPPARTAGFIANNVLQWCFYYPAVLDPTELLLSSDEQTVLGESLAAYRSGELLAALARYPANRSPVSDAERVYFAALHLSVGEVEATEAILAALPNADATSRPQRLSAALKTLIGAVKRQPASVMAQPQLATEYLAASYYEQSRALREVSLQNALKLARQAATNAPEFGFAWERVAELEFGFGRTREAMNALDKSLTLTPRNAQGIALKGFLMAARNDTREAIPWFDRALTVDAALGNAWLGRGLCRIRLGDAKGGREDLLVAAALEPQRAELRNYLGKAYANSGDYHRATKELDLGKRMDPKNPTAWFYSALLHQERNEVNAAIRDLEKAQELNDNRSVYRSQLLLDQDRAVRSANLASIYQDAGMDEVALREASRAVNYDYANYSAHLFLANSYNSLRDPNLINLRFETAAESEYLLANLLSPASAGTLSPNISQQEYSKLFERDRFGVVSATEYLSRGAWSQVGAQYGIFGDFSYNMDAFYRSDPGQRPNEDIVERHLALTLKQQITPEDTLMLRVDSLDNEGGDLTQYLYPTNASQNYRFSEKQEPIISLGYHHQWSPGIHTLFLFSRLADTFQTHDGATTSFLATRPENLQGVTYLSAVAGMTFDRLYRGQVEVYSGELQQIWQHDSHTTIIGTRFQYGHFETTDVLTKPSTVGSQFLVPAAAQDVTSLFRRVSLYAYHQWQIIEPLQLVGGITFDSMLLPANFRYAPVAHQEDSTDQISPKAGLIWTPTPSTTMRLAYTRSLAGASLDQSQRLEPSQIAGIIQSFRSVTPESVAGPSAGDTFESYGISVEKKFSSGTYLGLSGELLNSDVLRAVGSFDDFTFQFDNAIPGALRQDVDYQEKILAFTINQIATERWSFGSRYRLSQADLKMNFVDIPAGVAIQNFQPRQRLKGTLHQVDLFAVYNHPSGLFAEPRAVWYAQGYEDSNRNEHNEDFWQLNLCAGYRFHHRRAELMIGLLNLANQNYHLNPINNYEELARQRTLLVRFQINF